MNTAKQPTPRGKVLIVVHGDKFIEAYSEDRNIDVQFVHAPEVPISDKAEILAEELIQQSLPAFWSRVYSEGYRLKHFSIRPKTIDDEFNSRVLIAFCRELDRASKDGRNAT